MTFSIYPLFLWIYEYYLRHLLRQDRLPDFQQGKKHQDMLNYSEMIKGYILYTLPKRQIWHSINLMGREQWPLLQLRHDADNQGQERKMWHCVKLYGFWCLEVHKHTWSFAVHTCLLHMCFRLQAYLHQLYWNFAMLSFPRRQKDFFFLLKAEWFGILLWPFSRSKLPKAPPPTTHHLQQEYPNLRFQGKRHFSTCQDRNLGLGWTPMKAESWSVMTKIKPIETDSTILSLSLFYGHATWLTSHVT